MNLHNTETAQDVVAKLALPATTISLPFVGISLPDAVQIITGIYVLLMSIDKVYTIYLRYKEKNSESAK